MHKAETIVYDSADDDNVQAKTPNAVPVVATKVKKSKKTTMGLSGDNIPKSKKNDTKKGKKVETSLEINNVQKQETGMHISPTKGLDSLEGANVQTQENGMNISPTKDPDLLEGANVQTQPVDMNISPQQATSSQEENTVKTKTADTRKQHAFASALSEELKAEIGSKRVIFIMSGNPDHVDLTRKPKTKKGSHDQEDLEFTDEFFEVEAVLNEKGSPQNKWLFIQWKGYDISEATWEPISEIPPHLVQEYRDRLKEIETVQGKILNKRVVFFMGKDRETLKSAAIENDEVSDQIPPPVVPKNTDAITSQQYGHTVEHPPTDRRKESDASEEEAEVKRKDSYCNYYLKVQEFEGKGRGVYATESLPTGLEIVLDGVLWWIKSESNFKYESDYVKEYNKFITKHKNSAKLIEDVNSLQHSISQHVHAEKDKFMKMFEINGWREPEGTVVAVKIGSFINHSCDPSLRVRFDRERQTMVVETVQLIHAGQEVSVSYLSIADLDKRVDHRQAILADWGFYCSCTKCKRETNQYKQMATATGVSAGKRKTAQVLLKKLATISNNHNFKSSNSSLDSVVSDISHHQPLLDTGDIEEMHDETDSGEDKSDLGDVDYNEMSDEEINDEEINDDGSDDDGNDDDGSDDGSDDFELPEKRITHHNGEETWQREGSRISRRQDPSRQYTVSSPTTLIRRKFPTPKPNDDMVDGKHNGGAAAGVSNVLRHPLSNIPYHATRPFTRDYREFTPPAPPTPPHSPHSPHSPYQPFGIDQTYKRKRIGGKTPSSKPPPFRDFSRVYPADNTVHVHYKKKTVSHWLQQQRMIEQNEIVLNEELEHQRHQQLLQQQTQQNEIESAQRLAHEQIEYDQLQARGDEPCHCIGQSYNLFRNCHGKHFY